MMWSAEDAVAMAIIISISFAATVFLNPSLQNDIYPNPAVGGEYQEYLQIRDYSDCTKGNDSICMGGCVHTYRACQIQHCGSNGIGW